MKLWQAGRVVQESVGVGGVVGVVGVAGTGSGAGGAGGAVGGTVETGSGRRETAPSQTDEQSSVSRSY